MATKHIAGLRYGMWLKVDNKSGRTDKKELATRFDSPDDAYLAAFEFDTTVVFTVTVEDEQ